MPPVAQGAQYIYMDKSLLQQVQLGHHNEMSLVGDAGKHPSYSFSDSPPGMVASVTPQYLERTQKPEFLPGENHVAKLISALRGIAEERRGFRSGTRGPQASSTHMQSVSTYK